MANRITTKRIYEKPDAHDGYRMLIDRVWPRGIRKEDAKLDEWNKDIAPSTALRKWFGHKKERFEEFARRYSNELQHQTAELDRLRKITEIGKLCLLYGAKDEKLNQAVVLEQALLANK